MDPRQVETPKEKMTLRELCDEIKAEELVFDLIEKRDSFHFKKLIKDVEPKPRVNIRNKDGETPITLAAKSNCSSIVKMLIEVKADITVKDQHDLTPIMWAANNADTASITALIEAKADVQAKNKLGYNALWCTVDSASLQLLKAAIPVKPAAILDKPAAHVKPATPKKPGWLSHLFKSKTAQDEGYEKLMTEEPKLKLDA